MTPLTQSLLAGIAADDPEAFLGAGETVLAFKAGRNAALIAPYDAVLAEHPPAAEDIEALKSALVDCLQKGSTRNVGSAVLALGKLGDPGLVPLLREQLALQLQSILRQSGVIGNLICALHDNGEKVISNGTYSIDEVDKNISDARQYMARFGRVFPWGG